MKKLLLPLLLVAVILLLSCGGGNDKTASVKKEQMKTPVTQEMLLGKWNCIDLKLATGSSMPGLAKTQSYYIFKEDGTVVIGSPVAAATQTASYKIEDGHAVIYVNGEKSVDFSLDGSNLVFDDTSSDVKMIYAKAE